MTNKDGSFRLETCSPYRNRPLGYLLLNLNMTHYTSLHEKLKKYYTKDGGQMESNATLVIVQKE